MTQAFGTYDPSDAMRGAVDAGGRDGVRVKALEWDTPLFGYAARANTALGWYTVLDCSGIEDPVFALEHNAEDTTYHDTLEAAKAAAQQDFERRVLSCITDAPQPVQGSQGEAEPVAWVLPGADNANIYGFIDAMAYKKGEFTRPLYAHPANLAPSSALNAEAGLREAASEVLALTKTLRARPAFTVAWLKLDAALKGSRT